MPIIEFKCECGRVFEQLFKTHDGIPSTEMCKCGKMAKRIFSRCFGVVHTPIDYSKMDGLAEAREAGFE